MRSSDQPNARPDTVTKNRERQETGERGEAAVARYLTERDWTVRAQRWLCRTGELDLVVEKGDVIAFVEVRTLGQRSARRQRPEQTVGWRKRQRLERAAAAWLAAHDVRGKTVRFDVAGVVADPDRGVAVVRYHPNAFEARTLWF